jgi:hypothetical protein
MSKIEVNAIEPQCGTTLTVGASGDTITFPTGTTIVNNGTQTGFGRTGTVDWQTGSIKTTTFTAANGEGYFCNTSGGAFTVNLPAGSAGAIVSFADYTRTFQTNNLTITPNGSEKIGGVAANFVAQTEGQSITLVYVDATEGWINTAESTGQAGLLPAFVTATGGTITTVCTDYKVHTFTGPGTFTVCSAGNPLGSNSVDYMVVAGGGGGGSSSPSFDGGSGGGGAGGFREGYNPGSYTASPLATTALPVSVQGYPIAVGGGGAGGTNQTTSDFGDSGGNSIFSTITSTGGGGGGKPESPGGAAQAGLTGGSGGGAGSTDNVPESPVLGGAGNTPPVSPPQGNPGGDYIGTTSYAGGGGGGATAVGANGVCGPGTTGGGPGGAGATTSISASPTAYGGGGGGGGNCSPSTGGTGGGGNGGRKPSTAATAGTTNTGGGGGGSGRYGGASGAAGGSGIVIIRYKFQ